MNFNGETLKRALFRLRGDDTRIMGRGNGRAATGKTNNRGGRIINGSVYATASRAHYVCVKTRARVTGSPSDELCSQRTPANCSYPILSCRSSTYHSELLSAAYQPTISREVSIGNLAYHELPIVKSSKWGADPC